MEKGNYLCVYLMLRFKKEVGVDIKDDQEDVGGDPDEEEMDDVNLDYDMECHWKMVFEDNYVGVDYAKALLHAKRWDFHVNERENLVKGGYSVECSDHDKKKILWGVVDNHVVEEPTEHEDIGLRGFYLNFFDEDE